MLKRTLGGGTRRLMFYGRSTRMISYLIFLVRMIEFVRTWYQLIPVCVFCCVVASLCPAVCHTSQRHTASQQAHTASQGLRPTAPNTRLNMNRQ